MVNEVKESNSAELNKVRGDWDALTQKIHHLEAEVDASQALAREVCAERDELREVLEKKRTEIHAEDQDLINEIQTLLNEFAARANNPDLDDKSSFELLKQFAETSEKSADRLAKRAEVSKTVSSLEDFFEFLPVKNLDEARPFEPFAAAPISRKPKKSSSGALAWNRFFFSRKKGAIILPLNDYIRLGVSDLFLACSVVNP